MRGRPTPTSGGLGEKRGFETGIQAPCANALFCSAFCGGDTSQTRLASAPKARRPAGGGRRLPRRQPRTTSPPRWTASTARVKPLSDALHAFTRNGLRAGLRRARRGSGRPHPGAPAGQHVEPRRARGGPPLRRLIRCAATAFNTSTSASVCADPRCSMSRDPCRDFHLDSDRPRRGPLRRTYATGTSRPAASAQLRTRKPRIT